MPAVKTHSPHLHCSAFKERRRKGCLASANIIILFLRVESQEKKAHFCNFSCGRECESVRDVEDDLSVPFNNNVISAVRATRALTGKRSPEKETRATGCGPAQRDKKNNDNNCLLRARSACKRQSLSVRTASPCLRTRPGWEGRYSGSPKNRRFFGV